MPALAVPSLVPYFTFTFIALWLERITRNRSLLGRKPGARDGTRIFSAATVPCTRKAGHRSAQTSRGKFAMIVLLAASTSCPEMPETLATEVTVRQETSCMPAVRHAFSGVTGPHRNLPRAEPSLVEITQPVIPLISLTRTSSFVYINWGSMLRKLTLRT